MDRSLHKLKRVLDLESTQGYQDKAVVGGIRQFAVFWLSQAREEAKDEADLALIEQVGEVLKGYGLLQDPESRKEALDGLQEQIRANKAQKSTTETTIEPVIQLIAEPEKAPTVPVVSKSEEESPAEESPRPDPEGLRQSVEIIRGVGPKFAERLAGMGATTIWELLYLFPRRYDDYTLLRPINRLSYGEQVTVIGTIWETKARRTRNVKLVQSIINDGTGQIQATWFNQPWLADKLRVGQQIVLSGKVDQYLGRPVFQNPDWEPVEIEPLKTRRIVPIYPLTQGLTANKMREVMKQVTEQWASRVPDPLPESIRTKRNFYTLPKALKQAHFPDAQNALHHARRRIIFDELFLLQLGMMSHRREWQSVPGRRIPADTVALKQFARSLPFRLTDAQRRVIGEIAADMTKAVPMNRLLQGDVGSGKTAVAAAAMVLVVKAGLQATMMAPTEILAEQHAQGLRTMLGKLNIDVDLLTGSTTSAEREQLYARLSEGTSQVIVGTHALIQEKVQFKQLGLAIIDEQHRFGVDQRSALREKGSLSTNGSQRPNPHILVMSATPIPRTLALSLYGDLDLSNLDEMPPGRQEIKTRWIKPSERERAYSFLRGQIEKGRQAFIICPLVEESDRSESKSAVEEHKRLQEQVFPDLKLGLLHGRMKSAEKEVAMNSFYGGETNILVATSVIEVGIDVPNSTVILIEGANHFGLAQLHQFRGRVGRGEHQSYCLLLADTVSGDAEERLSALEQTNDGFALAEKDLEIRGPGEFFGRRQSGLPELQMASLLDLNMLAIAREEAQSIFESDPSLKEPQHQPLQEKIAAFWEDAGDVS